MTTSSLIKTTLNKSVADGIYNEIMSRYSRYYYFLGRTLTWEDELAPPYPIDSYAYELATRNEMITLKEIKPTDVAYVIPRYDWTSGTVYDQYDDQYCKEIQGINLIDGGNSYATAPYVYIGSTGSTNWGASTAYASGILLKSGSNYYVVTNTGITSSTAPTHTTGSALNGTATLEWVEVIDGGGSGATATSSVLDGQVIDITLTHRGTNYISPPSVIIAGSSGASARAESVVSIAPSGAQRLEQAVFYVVTDEFNVYKCLDNNLNTPSTVKPTGTGVDAIITSDGYMWKFMYNIPIALRNKFLTDQYIPVVTALRNQFYSNGNLQSIRIDAAGSGYTFGSIVVQGDGYSVGDQLHLKEYVLSSGGEEYNTPVTITVDPPITGVAQWQASTMALVGQHIQSGDNVYTVTISGLTDASVAPVHRFGIVKNGDCALEYKGTVPTADVTVTDGVITDIVFYGMVSDVQVLGGGSGYTSAPIVNFSGGNGSNATAVAVINENGSVIKVVVNDPGLDFTEPPTVTFGTQWTASTAVTIGQQIYYSNRLYTVTAAGTTATAGNYPVHSTGTQTNGTASLAYAGVTATAQAHIKYGSGYNSYPTVTVSGLAGTGAGANIYFTGEKTEAKLIPIFENGALVAVQTDDEGIGYSYANLTVEGNGSGAVISADLSPGDVNTLQANIELLTVDGRIMNIPVISSGYGYGAASVIINGDGTGATAEAVIQSGRITKIRMTSYGSGYRWATATIDGSGWGAKARPIISPYGGHGKNALTNLYTRYLMFYSNMAQDKNQGFDVNNDYRQLGIVKRARRYGSTADYTSTAGSACWVVSGSANTTLFKADYLIYKIDDGTRFRIVTNNGSALLIQSLDNSSPVIGSTFSNSTGDLFTCSAVTAPTVDKYSGDLLFIDNRAAFTPTADQTVTMRTVIKF